MIVEIGAAGQTYEHDRACSDTAAKAAEAVAYDLANGVALDVTWRYADTGRRMQGFLVIPGPIDFVRAIMSQGHNRRQDDRRHDT